MFGVLSWSRRRALSVCWLRSEGYIDDAALSKTLTNKFLAVGEVIIACTKLHMPVPRGASEDSVEAIFGQ
jgi:hypothetical protein